MLCRASASRLSDPVIQPTVALRATTASEGQGDQQHPLHRAAGVGTGWVGAIDHVKAELVIKKLV